MQGWPHPKMHSADQQNCGCGPPGLAVPWALRTALPERACERGVAMAALTIAFPIRPEKVEQARRWGREKMGPRKAELAESDRRVGLTRESWHLQATTEGFLMLLSCDGD